MYDTIKIAIPYDKIKANTLPQTLGHFPSNPDNWHYMKALTLIENTKKTIDYLPHIHISEFHNKKNKRQKELRLEFSIPKLLYGNNCTEIGPKDFNKLVTKLQYIINGIGITIDRETIEKALVCKLHSCKVIDTTLYDTCLNIINAIRKGAYPQNTHNISTSFELKGHQFKIYTNSFALSIYDKKQEIKDANIINALDARNIKELLRWEVQLNDKITVTKTLEYCGIHLKEITLKTIFKKYIATRINKYFWDKYIIKNQQLICSSSGNIQDILQQLRDKHMGAQDILAIIGILYNDKIDWNNIRQILNSESYRVQLNRIEQKIKQITLKTNIMTKTIKHIGSVLKTNKQFIL